MKCQACGAEFHAELPVTPPPIPRAAPPRRQPDMAWQVCKGILMAVVIIVVVLVGGCVALAMVGRWGAEKAIERAKERQVEEAEKDLQARIAELEELNRRAEAGGDKAAIRERAEEIRREVEAKYGTDLSAPEERPSGE